MSFADTLGSTSALVGGGTVLAAYGFSHLYRYGQAAAVSLCDPRPDPLAYVVPPPLPTTDLRAVPVGMDDAGRDVYLPLEGSHLLVAGATGSGKGSVLWSLLLGVAPAVQDGTCTLWAVDPKGGMELTPGRRLFDQFVTEPEDAATLLEAAVRSMDRRATRLARAEQRVIEVSTHDPLVVIVVDEVADLLDSGVAALDRRIARALRSLLRKGRAVGVVVIAATQDARKEVLAFRDLFPMRVALRTPEASQADMILGRGARDRGAHTDTISRATPGVAYLMTEAGRPRRVRFPYITDDKIRATAARYGAAA